MGTTLISFVIVLGILILVHEFGHFIVARLSGVGVERFSIGFGPVLWRYRGKATEYCLSAIPMGGYVKMMGDDENPLEGGKTGAVDPAKAFNAKPLWIRFLIVFAGPGMNFVLAVVIFAVLALVLGRAVIPPVVGSVTSPGPAAQAGLKPGDRIVALNGRPVQDWDEVLSAVQDGHGAPVALSVRGEGGERTLTVTPTASRQCDLLGDPHEVWDLGARPYLAPVIGDVIGGQPAAKAGLRSGDTVLAVGGKPVSSWDDMAQTIHARPGQPTRLDLKRGAETLTVTVTPNAVKQMSPECKEVAVGLIGIGQAPGGGVVRPNPAAALWHGLRRTTETTVVIARALHKLVVGKFDRSSIGGPIQIAVAAGEQARQGLIYLAGFTAVISVNLFLLNLLPVPMLDGGHLLFFAFEAVLGRPLSVRKREVAQQVGFVLLMLLMVYAVYNDLARLDVFRFFR
ncbi:MAG TPA: RIP metalloprotease RseP [Methylomirabilota bacterium]|nr:RIP metalloprotease RseP [Methylomirabilota bacterium]